MRQNHTSTSFSDSNSWVILSDIEQSIKRKIESVGTPLKDWEDFLKPKIVWKRVGSIIRFSYDENGLMALDSTCFATGENVKYLTCILNSNMGHYLLKNAPKTGTGDLLISVQAVEPVKTPIPDSKIKRDLEILLEKQLQSVSADVDKEINRKVYGLYDLSDLEMEFIDNQAI